MGYVYLMNPWRKGREAGRVYYDAFDAYRKSLRTDQPLPRPEQPTNPYPMPKPGRASKNCGRIKWDEGFRQSRTDFEWRQRCGGKEPQWNH